MSHREAQPSDGRLLLIDVAALGLLVLSLTRWFSTWPPSVPAALPPAGLVVALLLRAGLTGWRPPRPRPETLVCVAVAIGYRSPALLHPWGWVNKDGAYGAFVALHILQGTRPAPVFTEGAHYQGTLKAHLAAFLSLFGPSDLSFLMTAASVLLSLVFLVATMALARRVAGDRAALGAGLYLALGPKFLTSFSLNCVGQYVDVLALGGLALALLARILSEPADAATSRLRLVALGLLLGAAFWQQPIALGYWACVAVALILQRDWVLLRRSLWSLLGLGLGLLPVLLWNLEHDWATREILTRNVGGPAHVLASLPDQVWRTLAISFPVLAGLSPGHPWSWVPTWAAAALPLGLLLGYLATHAPEIRRSVRGGQPAPALLAPLLMLCSLLLFWSTPGELIHFRPRYLLPVMAATAVHVGAVFAWGFGRQRVLAGLALAGLLGFNAAGTVPRLRAGAGIALYYRDLVRSLEEKGIRTGYADFSVSAPVTMFTAERIVLSPALGPTPAHESPSHAARVTARGPDAYILDSQDDLEHFAALLEALGVTYRFDPHPVPVFYDLSRRLPLDEVSGWRKP